MELQPISYQIVYNHKNITKDISDYLLSLKYDDRTEAKSDEIELELHDKDLLWQNDWYPAKGDKLSIEIRDKGASLQCGTFTIDEMEIMTDRNGDIVRIRGMAAAITKKIRTKRSSAHENKTLKELAESVATNHGLTLQGQIGNIRIGRITQYQESDLSFLHRISSKFGYTFSIRDNTLTFTNTQELESKAHILTMDKTYITKGYFHDKSKEVFSRVDVNYHNPKTNQLISAAITREQTIAANIAAKTEALKKIVQDAESKKEDTSLLDDLFGADVQKVSMADIETIDQFPGYDGLNINEPVDDDLQAESVARAAMHKSITREKTCSISCPGSTLLVSGINIELTGFGQLSGIYHITESAHNVDRANGYETTFQAKRVDTTAKKKYRPKLNSTSNSKTLEEINFETYKKIQQFKVATINALKKRGLLEDTENF
ncbi:MAG: phage late control D family protein [Flavisolibacter sp.]